MKTLAILFVIAVVITAIFLIRSKGIVLRILAISLFLGVVLILLFMLTMTNSGVSSPEDALIYVHDADGHEIACREDTPWAAAESHGFSFIGVQARDRFLIESCPPSQAYVYSKSGEGEKDCSEEWKQSAEQGYVLEGIKPRAKYTIVNCNLRSIGG